MKLNRSSRHAALVLAFHFGMASLASALTVVDYWRMGDNDPNVTPGVALTTTDNTGGRTITLSGDPQYSTSVSPKAAARTRSRVSMQFVNGSYGIAPVVPALVNNFGIELWVKPDTALGTKCLAFNGNPDSNGWGLYQIGSSYVGQFGGGAVIGYATATPGVWTHLALVRDNGTTTLYVNGVASGSTSPSVPDAPAGNFGVGANPSSPASDRFVGFIDEVRVFTFAANGFSPNELLSHFWSPTLTLKGANPLTNECHSNLNDPGTTMTAPILAVAAGNYHSLAIKADGAVAGWGYNLNNQITIPANSTNVLAIAAGGVHSLALRADGTVLGWGHNGFGQTTIPASATNVSAIAAGEYHSLALRPDGRVLGWGYNNSGQTTIPAKASNVVAIAAGKSHSLALRADGTVVGWGLNTSGQVTIPGTATNVVAIAAGANHSLALRADGTVLGWGLNSNGETVIPATATNVVAIAGAIFHSLALRADGTVVAWGYNANGQLNVPTNATDVVAIAAGGGGHNLVVRGDGTVLSWGYNANGQASVPASLNAMNLPVSVSASVNINTPGTYSLTYTTTNQIGAVVTATRTVQVVDTTPPVISILGSNPIVQLINSTFVDPGATARDVCSGNLAVTTNGTVNPSQIGSYTITYTSTDPSGNVATRTRTVVIGDRPSVSELTMSVVATNSANGSRTVQLTARINPNGLPTAVDFEYGLTLPYAGLQGPVNLPASFTSSNVSVVIPNFSAGVAYHWRVVARNNSFSTAAPDQTFSIPSASAPGDINGDGLVSQSELDTILATYRPNDPWIAITNIAGLGGTNVTFALINSTAGAYNVEYSTNMVDWEDLGPALPRYEFTDSNAPASPQRYYRLRQP